MAYVWDVAKRQLIASSSREWCDEFAAESPRDLVVTDTAAEPWRRFTLIPGGKR